MSDGITDSYRDQRRAECFANFLLRLVVFLEDGSSSVEKLELLKQAASQTDDVPRGLMSGQTSLSEGLNTLIANLQKKDERTWGNLLMTAHGDLPDISFYRLKKLSPFKDKILLQVDYGCGFVTLRGDFQNFIDNLIRFDKNLKVYDADTYLITLPKETMNEVTVVWLKCGISGVRGPRKAR